MVPGRGHRVADLRVKANLKSEPSAAFRISRCLQKGQQLFLQGRGRSDGLQAPGPATGGGGFRSPQFGHILIAV